MNTVRSDVSRLELIVNVGNQTISIAEGGNFSIDINPAPVRLKADAMRHYLQTDVKGVPSERGAYFGNQNQSPDDRDASMRHIKGLQIFGVDEKQETIIPGVVPSGSGMEGTLRKLKEFIGFPRAQRPAFIGFDVDDTLLGLRPDRTKEELLTDRREIAEALAVLAQEGTNIAVFSDGDADIVLNRIGYPLASLMTKPLSISFYVNKMATKVILTTQPSAPSKVNYDQVYSANSLLSAKVVSILSGIVGKVDENDEGIISATGILGNYYTQTLTQKTEERHVRNVSFYPDFKTQSSTRGNVTSPQPQWRGYNLQTKEASMLCLAPFPPAHRRTIITLIAQTLSIT